MKGKGRDGRKEKGRGRGRRKGEGNKMTERRIHTLC